MILAGSSTELAHALAVAPEGETLQLHAGTFIAPRGGFVVPRGLRLEGTHPLRNHLRGGTIIQPASPADHGIVIPDGIDNVTISDVIVRGNEQPGEGDGIHLVHAKTPGCRSSPSPLHSKRECSRRIPPTTASRGCFRESC